MGSHNRVKLSTLKNLRNTKASPGFGIPQGVQAFTTVFLGLLTSFGVGFLINNSAYAAYSASISRTSSGTVTLSDSSGGSIKPSSTGTLGTGSDVVTVSSNCSAGYNLYVSAISGGSTNLSTSGGLDYIPSTTTATGSETVLSKDTWGIGKDGTTFSKLQSYSEDLSTMSPLYTDSGNKDYTIYYGVNVSTAKTPGTYTGDVLYTVLMNGACLEYTLKFDSNGATSSELPDQTISFGQAVDLSEYSTTDKISKTGYHLSGWKIKDGDGTLLPTNNNTSLDDGESSELTLIAQWKANTYTITYNAGSTGGTCNVSDTSATYDQDVTLSSAKCTKTNYDQTGWSINQDGSTKDYTLGQTLTKPNLTTENNGSFPLYPYFESTTLYFQTTSCSSLTEGQTTTLVDSRDNQEYTVYRIPADSIAENIRGMCFMTKDLNLGAVAFQSTASSKMPNANGAMTLSPDDSNYTTPTGSDSITVPTSTVTVSTTYSSTNNYNNKYYKANGTGKYAGRGYYSWGAAMVACPKDWRLPTMDELNNSYSYDSSTTGISYHVGNSTSNLQASPYSFVLGGAYDNGWSYGGSWGRYWTSSGGGNLAMDPRLKADGSSRACGFAVRCVAKP